MTLSEKQFRAVSALPGPKRYAHLVKRVVDAEEAWGLWDEGWALVSDDAGSTAFALWPARDYAAACAAGTWAGYEPSVVPLDELVETLLPRLDEDGLAVAAFMTMHDRGPLVTPSQLRADLLRELDRY